jgi:hypothetical protein
VGLGDKKLGDFDPRFLAAERMDERHAAETDDLVGDDRHENTLGRFRLCKPPVDPTQGRGVAIEFPIKRTQGRCIACYRPTR